jgi:hypothetical protein
MTSSLISMSYPRRRVSSFAEELNRTHSMFEGFPSLHQGKEKMEPFSTAEALLRLVVFGSVKILSM